MPIQADGGKGGTGPLQSTSGVEGDAPVAESAGVRGKNDFIKATGFLAGTNPFHTEAVGAYGESDQYGVLGIARTPSGIGVFGTSVGGAGTAVRGDASPTGLAGQFIGNVEVKGKITHDGELSCTKTISCFDVSLGGGDCAEDFDVALVAAAEPGTVMCLDAEGNLRPCSSDYNKKVAGVISGAGSYRPGLVLDRREGASDRAPLALIGKVYCKVDADRFPIEVGDLLTTSSTPGHAMKAEDPMKSFGAVLGKALQRIASGRALIPILVALQ
jgi:hypothetical protein